MKLWAHESNESSTRINLKLRGYDIANIEQGILGLGRTDPFIEIYKKHDYLSPGKQRWQLIYRSETVKNHLNPLWEEYELSVEDFCDNDLDKSIKIQLWD